MPYGLFDTLTVDELRAVLRRQADRDVKRNDDQWKLTEDFLENRQIERTSEELRKRYPTRQALSKGEQIQPFILPIADRYVAEAANAYNKPVTRELVDESGDVVEDATEQLKWLTEGLDEKLHQVERYTVAQDAQPGFVQPRRGKLDVQPAPLHQVYPVLPIDATKANRSDQADYFGHVVQVDTIEREKRKWVFATPAAHYVYESEEWSEVSNVEIIPNEMKWPQQDDSDKESIALHPLQTLVWWHRYIPMNKLLPVSDVPVAALNLEINVQLSCILDTIRKQGWSQVYAKVMDASNPPASVPFGTGFMFALGPEEDLGALTLPNDYTGMVSFFEFLVQFFAILLRQSPNDFAIGGTSPASGFAKLVDSLPKLEARADRIRRLKAIEENVLWPRIGAVGQYLGKLPSGVENLRMRTTFSDVDFPMSTDENIKEDEHRIKHGWTTDAKIYAERNGVSLAEAEAVVEENLDKSREQNADGIEEQQQQIGVQPAGGTDAFSDAIAKFQAEGLNGIQITSLTGVLEKVAVGALPRAEMIELLKSSFPMLADRIETIVGSIGKGFTPSAAIQTQPAVKESNTMNDATDDNKNGKKERRSIADIVAQRSGKLGKNA